jgi:CheY-like chemotaxis protein
MPGMNGFELCQKIKNMDNDTHGWNAVWSDSLATTKADINETNGERKVVIGGTKR